MNSNSTHSLQYRSAPVLTVGILNVEKGFYRDRPSRIALLDCADKVQECCQVSIGNDGSQSLNLKGLHYF